MSDPVDELLRTSIESRVIESADPRPFEALAAAESPVRVDLVAPKSQRGLLVLATAGVLLLAVAGWAAFRPSSDNVLAGPFESTEGEPPVPTTAVTATTAPTATAPSEPSLSEPSAPERELVETVPGAAVTTVPADAESGTEDDAGLALEVVTGTALDAARVEAIGCWFTPNGADEPVFFSGFDGGFIQVNGEIIGMERGSGAGDFELEGGFDAGGPFDPAPLFTGDGYVAIFTDIGDPEQTSIESGQWSITLTVDSATGTYGPVEGIIWCGV